MVSLRIRRARGFSLAEMLVVIGIVALLMSILLPATRRAWEQARRVQCMANLRTLTAAWLAYANSNRGRLCGATAGTPDDPRFCDWVTIGDTDQCARDGVLWPYVRDARVYKCPADTVDSFRTYRINSWLNGEGPAAPGDKTPAKTLSRVRRAAETFVFAEETSRGDANFNSFIVPPYKSNDWLDVPAAIHGNAGVISFADGHAALWQFNSQVHLRRTLTSVPHTADADLLQIERWIGHEPYPPGVAP